MRALPSSLSLAAISAWLCADAVSATAQTSDAAVAAIEVSLVMSSSPDGRHVGRTRDDLILPLLARRRFGRCSAIFFTPGGTERAIDQPPGRLVAAQVPALGVAEQDRDNDL